MSANNLLEHGKRDPQWVDAVLDWRWTWLVARTAVVALFLMNGLTKLFDFPAAIAEQEHFGLRPGVVWASITMCVELVAPVLIISGRYVWLGAGALGVFTALAAFLTHAFWAMHGQDRFIAMNEFFEHMSLVAALVMIALIAEHAQLDCKR